MIRLICVLVGYVFGLFQTAFIYGKMHGIDIRDHGSGNAGTTNTLRVLGLKAGLIVLLGDILKCIVPVLLVKLYCNTMGAESFGDMEILLMMYAGAGAILGHNYPFYLKFKGGKGIAATAGLIIALPWQITLVEAIVFFSVFFISHYVSLGSLCIYAVLVIEMIVLGQMGVFGMDQPVLVELYVLTTLLAVMAFWKHRENIGRLIKGEERKTYLKKKSDQ